MSGRGHTRLRLCSKKNYELKKYAQKKALVVQIPTKDIELPSCKISVPLTVSKDAPSDTIGTLHCQLRNLNLGEINKHLMEYEASLDEDYSPTIAKSMMVFMVRGLISKLNFPYAQYACADLSGDLLIDPVWEAISRLERQGIE